MQVTVYSSCDNGPHGIERQGKSPRGSWRKNDKFRAKFEIPYQPGELRAVGLNQGKIVSSKILRSAGPAAGIRLVADRQTLRADRNDLAYVAAEITDAEGNLLPDAALPVQFTVSGEGDLAALGSGSPNKPEGFLGPVRTTWHGRALVILRPKGTAGRIKLRAEAAGLSTEEIEVSAQSPPSQ